jgi:uncharacterized protein YlaI
MSKWNREVHEFICKECGNKYPLARRSDKRKEEGHIKHLYCIKCKKMTAHEEKYI